MNPGRHGANSPPPAAKALPAAAAIEEGGQVSEVVQDADRNPKPNTDENGT